MKIIVNKKLETTSEYGAKYTESVTVGIDGIYFYFNPKNQWDLHKAQIVMKFIMSEFKEEFEKIEKRQN
jgi:hypothetical protein